jgi:hypothetical protein
VKKLIVMLSACAAMSAESASFLSYKDSLQADLLCANYPDTDIKTHVWLLREIGAIDWVFLGAERKLYEFKVKQSGLTLFGFPFVAFRAIPGALGSAPYLGVVLAAKPAQVAEVIKTRAINAGVAGLEDKGEAGSRFSGINPAKGFEISLSAEGDATVLGCGQASSSK